MKGMKQQRGLQMKQGRFRNCPQPRPDPAARFSQRHGRSYQSFMNVDRAFNKHGWGAGGWSSWRKSKVKGNGSSQDSNSREPWRGSRVCAALWHRRVLLPDIPNKPINPNFYTQNERKPRAGCSCGGCGEFTPSLIGKESTGKHL